MQLFHSKDAGAKVFIAIPAYGNVPVELLHSLWDAQPVLAEHGILTELLIASGGCHVDDVRNLLLACFLESDCEQFVFIDDDTRFNALDLVTLINIDKDVAAGICPKKTYPLDFAFRPIPGAKVETGLIEVEGVGAAFLKISRAAVQKLSDTAEHYTSKIGGIDKDIPLIFERTLEDGFRWGGDYSFCHKWARLGGKMFVDTEMTFGHVGTTEYVGSLGHCLREEHGLTEQWIVDKLKELKTRPPSQAEIISLVQAWGNDNWTANVELLCALDMIARDGEGTILEFGSGLSSLIMAASGRPVITCDHSEEWTDKVTTIRDMVSTRIVTYTGPIDNEWYTIYPEDEAAMIFIDGPPQKLADRSIIAEKITPADGCVFVVDDIAKDKCVLDALTKKFQIEFNDFGRYAIGVYHDLHKERQTRDFTGQGIEQLSAEGGLV